MGASGVLSCSNSPAMVWRLSAMPSRANISSWRYSGRPSTNLPMMMAASSELWAMDLGMICAARGAMRTPISAPGTSSLTGTYLARLVTIT